MNVVSALGSFASSALGLSGGVANFALQAGRFLNGELVVVRFEGKAKLNEPFEYEVTLESAIGPDRAVAGMHGLAARLSIQSSAQGPRRIEGIVSDFATIGADDRNGEKVFHYRIRIVPRLFRLSMCKAHRVFEDQSALQVALAVLGDHRIVPTLRVQNRAMYRPIPFLYQRGETDLEFVNRVLALAGITYFFIQPLGSDSDFPSRFAPPTRRTSDDPLQIFESMVLADTSYGMSQIDLPETLDGGQKHAANAPRRSAREGVLPTDPDFGSGSDTPGNELSFEVDGKMGSADETVASFEMRYQLAPTSVSVRDWISADDLVLEQTRRSDTSGDRAGFRADTGLGTVEYQRDGSMQATFGKGDAETSVKRALEQVRSRTIRATGKTDSRRIAVGYRFSLTDHPVDSLNTEYIVTSVACQGTNPEKLLDAKTPVYESSFECMPSSLRPCPPKPEPLPALGPEPATVVGGPDGLPLCDDLGRISVRFHWAGLGGSNASGGNGECSVLWRESWAGPGYGTMSVPRVGSEVLVDFPRQEGGQPIAIGQLYSAGNPPPFSFVNEPHRVGIRSRSLPVSGVFNPGYNEVSLLDAPGAERLSLRAQRDLVEEVLHDRRTRVGADQLLDVEGSVRERIAIDRKVVIGGDSSLEVRGNRTDQVHGDLRLMVDDNNLTTTRGNETRTVLGSLSEMVAGAANRSIGGMHTARYASDAISRHAGNAVAIVGAGDSPKSAALHVEGGVHAFATQKIELEVGDGFTIVCGESRITVTANAITIASPTVSMNGQTLNCNAANIALTASDTAAVSAQTATVTGSNAATISANNLTLNGQASTVTLTSSASIQAASISLASGGSGSSSQQQHSDTTPAQVTTINLVSDKGDPCPNRTVILRRGGDGGDEHAMALDSSGALTLEWTDAFDICFPEDPLAALDGQSAPSPSVGPLVPYVVREGDYVQSLAHRFGFDADAMWGDPKNSDLKTLRLDPNVLLPGDILFIAKPAKRNWTPVALGSANNFSTPVKLVHVKAQLLEDGQPYAGEVYEVDGATLKPGTLDGNGFFEADVPVTVETFTVRLPNQGNVEFQMGLGHLDPSGEPMGILQRLKALAVFGPSHVPNDDPSIDLELGLSLFQSKYALDVTGSADAATKAKLLQLCGR